MLINVVTFILLICVCLGSQLSNLIQQRLVPNGTALSSNLLAMNNSAEDIFKNFISEGAKKPEDVDKVIIVLKSLIGEQDGYVDGLDNKIKAELENWNKVKAASKAAIAKSDGELVEATKGNSKVKLDEGKKESAAKQAHTDAKANKNKLMPNINRGFSHSQHNELWNMLINGKIAVGIEIMIVLKILEIRISMFVLGEEITSHQ